MIVAFLISASSVWIRPSTNACSFLASSYSAFSREVAVLLGVVDPLGDLGPLDGDHLVELRAELVEAVLGEVGGLVVHCGSAPRCGWSDVGGRRSGGLDKGKNSRRAAGRAPEVRPGGMVAARGVKASAASGRRSGRAVIAAFGASSGAVHVSRGSAVDGICLRRSPTAMVSARACTRVGSDTLRFAGAWDPREAGTRVERRWHRGPRITGRRHAAGGPPHSRRGARRPPASPVGERDEERVVAGDGAGDLGPAGPVEGGGDRVGGAGQGPDHEQQARPRGARRAGRGGACAGGPRRSSRPRSAAAGARRRPVPSRLDLDQPELGHVAADRRLGRPEAALAQGGGQLLLGPDRALLRRGRGSPAGGAAS